MFWLIRKLWEMGAEFAIYELENKRPERFMELGQAISKGRFPIDSETDEIYCDVYKRLLKKWNYI